MPVLIRLYMSITYCFRASLTVRGPLEVPNKALSRQNVRLKGRGTGTVTYLHNVQYKKESSLLNDFEASLQGSPRSCFGCLVRSL